MSKITNVKTNATDASSKGKSKKQALFKMIEKQIKEYLLLSQYIPECVQGHLKQIVLLVIKRIILYASYQHCPLFITLPPLRQVCDCNTPKK